MKEPELKLGPASGIPGSRIRAIANLAEEYPGTLRLFYGEDTLPTPDFIKKAGQAAIDRNLTYYTPNAGYLSLREVIADQVRMLHGVEIDPRRDVTVTASGMVAMVLAFQATLAAGDSAIVVTRSGPTSRRVSRFSARRRSKFPWPSPNKASPSTSTGLRPRSSQARS